MNFKILASIGAKILVAGAAGLALFLGISEGTKSVKENNNNCNVPPQNNLNQNTWNPNVNQQTQPQQQNNQNVEPSKGDIVMGGIKGATETLGKLSLLAQSLLSFVDSVVRLFKNNGNNQPFYNAPWYANQANYGNNWSRVNSFIIQSNPNPYYNYNGCNNYPF